MRVLVTGATGFIGQHVANALVQRGYLVCALARPTADVSYLRSLGVEIRQGDILDQSACLTAAQDCEAILHLAADYRLWAPNPKEIERTNVEGTRNILQAAIRHQVAEFIYTGSIVTLQPSPADPEPRPAHISDLATAYECSKWQAEPEVEVAVRAGLPAVTVYPTMPIGSRDRRPTAGGQMIIDFMQGRLPFCVEMRINVVAVQDVALGHVLALEKGRVGQGYILGHQNTTLTELLETLGRLTGRWPPRAKIPLGLAWFAAVIDERVATPLLRRPPRVCLGSVHVARRNLWTNCEKAVRELGLPLTPVEQALEEAVKWFQDNGYLC